MRQLVFLGPGHAEWREAAEPAVDGALEAIIEPVAVATCDLDVAILRGTFRAFPGPFPLGHEGVARVTDIGGAVTSVSPGDLVIVPFQISCGTCRACQGGRTGNCGSVAPGSMYGYEPFGGPWGGFLADKVRVPYADAMLIPLDPAADPAAVASLSDTGRFWALIPRTSGWKATGPWRAAASSTASPRGSPRSAWRSSATWQLTARDLTDLTVSECYEGPCTAEIRPSATAPLYRLPALTFLEGFYWRCDFSLTGGRILHDYLGEQPARP